MTHRSKALADLMEALFRHEERGDRIPCVNPKSGHWWISEDREETKAAELACSSCPALAACAEYVDEHPEAAGVWAGVAYGFSGRRTSRRSA